MTEKSSFLRYALFYGLYFNYSDLSLSYVKEIDEEESEPYSFLGLLGLTPDQNAENRGSDSPTVPFTGSTAAQPKPLSLQPMMLTIPIKGGKSYQAISMKIALRMKHIQQKASKKAVFGKTRNDSFVKTHIIFVHKCVITNKLFNCSPGNRKRASVSWQ